MSEYICTHKFGKNHDTMISSTYLTKNILERVEGRLFKQQAFVILWLSPCDGAVYVSSWNCKETEIEEEIVSYLKVGKNCTKCLAQLKEEIVFILKFRFRFRLSKSSKCLEYKLKWLDIKTCSTNWTIWSSVVSLVRNSSMSVTRSMQMAQVRALPPCKIISRHELVFGILQKHSCTLGLADTDARRLARRMRGIFMTKANLGWEWRWSRDNTWEWSWLSPSSRDNTLHPFIFSCV